MEITHKDLDEVTHSIDAESSKINKKCVADIDMDGTVAEEDSTGTGSKTVSNGTGGAVHKKGESRKQRKKAEKIYRLKCQADTSSILKDLKVNYGN